MVLGGGDVSAEKRPVPARDTKLQKEAVGSRRVASSGLHANAEAKAMEGLELDKGGIENPRQKINNQKKTKLNLAIFVTRNLKTEHSFLHPNAWRHRQSATLPCPF